MRSFTCRGATFSGLFLPLQRLQLRGRALIEQLLQRALEHPGLPTARRQHGRHLHHLGLNPHGLPDARPGNRACRALHGGLLGTPRRDALAQEHGVATRSELGTLDFLTCFQSCSIIVHLF